MSHPAEKATKANSQYELASFSPIVQEAILARAAEQRERHPITVDTVVRFFGMPVERVSDSHLRYFEAYTKLAEQQLIIGAYFGPNSDSAVDDTDESKLAALKQPSKLIFDKEGPLYFHDIGHTIVAWWGNDFRGDLVSLTPPYMTVSRYEEDYSSKSAYQAAQYGVNSQESLTLILFMRGKESSLKQIMDMYGNWSNFAADIARPGNALLIRELSFLYADKENPLFLFDAFLRTTLLLVQIHAPEVAKLFTPRPQEPLDSIPRET